MRPIRVIFVGESESAADRVLAELRAGDFAPESAHAATLDELRAIVPSGSWDLICSAWRAPGQPDLDVAALRGELAPDLPLIVFLGPESEPIAGRMIRAGADEYMFVDRLSGLVPVVERVLRDANTRREKREIQHTLMLAERMAAIGTLASGIAHEINNPLAAVIANLSYLEDAVRAHPAAEGDEELLEVLTDAQEAADRVKRIVRDLRTFARADFEARVIVDLRATVEQALTILGNEIKHRALVERAIGETPPISANEAQIAQLVLALVHNALQALPDGQADSNVIRIVTGADPTGRALLEVHDSGRGIPDAIKHRIFEPFFTTREVGTGRGLGLSVCHGIVASLGGTIGFESLPGRTVFRVVIPAHLDETAAGRPKGGGFSLPDRPRILVVDDEPAVARSIRRILEPRFEVLMANDAQRALDTVREAEPPVDLVVCDVMMPHMSGAELYAELSRVSPPLAENMVFVTGGTFSAATIEFLAAIPNPRLEKPFDPEKLVYLVASRVRR